MTSSAWDTISQNRRLNPRYKISLHASVSLVESETEESRWPTVLAETRDVSSEGLALVMPSAMMGCHNLEEGEHVLRIVLALPTTASVTVTAQLIHCALLGGPLRAEQGYLVGVKFERIGAEERLLYDEFIASLAPKR